MRKSFRIDLMKILLAGFSGMATEVNADTPVAIIGGQDNASNAYAALVSGSGSLTPVAGLPANSDIYATAMNLLGFSLIGGQANGMSGYVATVSPTGTLTPLSLSLTGTIYGVAINQSRTGLIGGQDSSNNAYAAIITPDGTITPLSITTMPAALIASTAINDMGVGLIGGEGDFLTYAAYIALDGTVTTIPTTSMSSIIGHIYSVAMNDQGVGIIGGYNENGSYAAFVTPAAGAPLVLMTPTGGQINGVAINNAGIGLIGGQDFSGNAYAGYATAQGTVVTPLFGSPFGGIINSVALNTSGTGLIGGLNGSDLYAALVQPSGLITPIITDSIGGQINWVAINDPGIGLIGGVNNDSGDAYAALVAPNGALTLLNTDNVTAINSVSVIPSGSQSILNAATPTSFGPYLSVAYTQLAAIYALESRFIGKNFTSTQTKGSEVTLLAFDEDELLVSNDELLAARPKCDNKKKQASPTPKSNSIWIAPFGDYVHLKNQGVIPSYKNQIAGALVGYDHQDSNYLVGACLGYAFNYISYGKGLGHGKIQEEMGCFYGSYLMDHFRLNGALWGGFYQFWNTRHTLSMITSKSKTHGWILSPHLGVATPWAIDQKERYVIEPFFTLDWINGWQKHLTESGKAGFNLKIGDLYSSLLQSEVGLRFYERFAYGWGDFCLEEKVSYVNQAPFHVNSITTSFVGAASGFPIAVASNKVENLGALQLMGSFFPKNKAYPYGGFTLQAMANGSYQSYFVSLFTGIEF